MPEWLETRENIFKKHGNSGVKITRAPNDTIMFVESPIGMDESFEGAAFIVPQSTSAASAASLPQHKL